MRARHCSSVARTHVGLHCPGGHERARKVKRTVSGACTDDDLEAATAVINLISVY